MLANKISPFDNFERSCINFKASISIVSQLLKSIEPSILIFFTVIYLNFPVFNLKFFLGFNPVLILFIQEDKFTTSQPSGISLLILHSKPFFHLMIYKAYLLHLEIQTVKTNNHKWFLP